MSNKKISELDELMAALDADLLAIVDVASGATKKITKANLLAGLLIEETDPVFEAWLDGPPNLSEFNDDIGYLVNPMTGSLDINGESIIDTVRNYGTNLLRLNADVIEIGDMSGGLGIKLLAYTIKDYYDNDFVTSATALVNPMTEILVMKNSIHFYDGENQVANLDCYEWKMRNVGACSIFTLDTAQGIRIWDGTTEPGENLLAQIDLSGNIAIVGTLTTGSDGITIGSTSLSEGQLQDLLNLI
jgi:hypothetical protein